MKTNLNDKIAHYGAKALYVICMTLAAFASIFTVGTQCVLHAATMASRAVALCDGPSPAANTTANMPQAKYTIHYNRVFMKFLYMRLNKLLMCTHQPLAEKSGQTIRNYMNVVLGADTNQQTEGTIGNPESVSTNFRDIVVGQWANYNNLSDFAFMTSISNDLENNRRVMAYQLGQTIDDLVMYMFDYLRTYDPRTAYQDATTSPYAFTKSIIEQMPASLSGANVPPMASGFYNGSIHPFFVGDLFLDNSNNSIVDIWKHTEAGQLKLEALTDPGFKGDAETQVISLAGGHWRQSTNQTQYANWQSSGKTAISTYLAGMDAIIFVNFPNKRHTKITPNWENLDLWAGMYQERTAYDPNGVIIGGTGYNVVLGVGLPPDPNATSRARIANAVPQTT